GARLLGWQVGHEHAVDAQVPGLLRQTLETVAEERVVVAEKEQGQLGLLPDASNRVEDGRERRPSPQGPLARALDHRPVGQWVGEGHAELEDVHSGFVHRDRRLDRAIDGGIAGGQEGHERLPALLCALREARANPRHGSTSASTSISTSMSGSMRRLTSTIVAAGRTSRKSSPCARPTASHCPMSVTNIRVRTTSLRLAPARESAFSMFRSAWTACA